MEATLSLTPDQLYEEIVQLKSQVAALQSRAPEGLLSSKTLRYLLALLGVAFGAIVLAALADRYLGISTPYLSDFLNLVGLNGGVGTTRNVVADHIAPVMAARNQNPPQAAPVAHI